MTAALASRSTARPSLPQPWASALPLILGSAPSRFGATRQPSSCPTKAADPRPNPRAGMDLQNEKLAASLATMRDGAAQLAAMQATLERTYPTYAARRARRRPWLGSGLGLRLG